MKIDSQNSILLVIKVQLIAKTNLIVQQLCRPSIIWFIDVVTQGNNKYIVKSHINIWT